MNELAKVTQLGMTPEELAASLQISNSSVQAILHGRLEPSQILLDQVRRLLDDQ